MTTNEFLVDQIGEVTRIQLPSRVDIANTKGFLDVVRGQLAESRLSIVLDFSRTEAIDSTALGAIIQLYKSLRNQGGDLRIAHVGDGVKRVLAITRVDRVFSIFDSVDEAIHSGRTSHVPPHH